MIEQMNSQSFKKPKSAYFCRFKLLALLHVSWCRFFLVKLWNLKFGSFSSFTSPSNKNKICSFWLRCFEVEAFAFINFSRMWKQHEKWLFLLVLVDLWQYLLNLIFRIVFDGSKNLICPSFRLWRVLFPRLIFWGI